MKKKNTPSVDKIESELQPKRMEESLLANKKLLQEIIDNTSALIYILDTEGRYILANHKLENLLGVSSAQLIGQTRNIALPEEIAAQHRNNDLEIIASGQAKIFEETHLEADGRHYYLTNKFPLFDSDNRVYAVCGISTDMTERIKSEQQINYLKRSYATLSQINQTIVRVQDRQELFDSICKVAIDFGQFRLAWIGLYDEASGKLTPVAEHGLDGNKLSFRENNAKEMPFKEGLTGASLRSGQVEYSNDIQVDPRMAHWRETGVKDNYRSVAAIPIRQNGKVIGLLNLYSTDVDFFATQEEQSLLAEMGLDISFALDNMQREAERRQAEKKLRESEFSLKRSQAVAHVGDWSWDTETNLVTWSDEMHRVFGLDPQSFTGDLNEIIAKAIHPEDREKVARANEAVVDVQAPAPLEYRVVWPDQSVHTVLAIPGERFTDEKGNILRLTGIVQDITERKQAEETLKDSEEKYRFLFENNPHPMWVYDLKTLAFLAVNESAMQKYGYTREEFLGITIADIRPTEDISRLKVFVAQPRTPLSRSGEWRHRLKSGNIIDVDITSHTLRMGDNDSILVVAQDITVRKQAEEKLQKAYENLSTAQRIAHIGSHEHDIINNRLYWSDEVFRIFGISRDEFVESPDDFFNRIHPEDRARVSDTIAQAYRAKKSTAFEHRIVHTDGSVRYVEEQFHMVFNEKGDHIRNIGTIQDITERKQAELEIQHRTEDLALIKALNDAVNRGEDISGIAEVFARETRSMFACQDVTLYFLSPDAKYLEMQSTTLSSNLIQKIEKLIGQPIPKIQILLKEGSYFNKILTNEHGIIASDPQEIQQWIEEFTETTFLPQSIRAFTRKIIPKIHKLLNIGSTLAIPLISSGRTIGLLDMSSMGQFTEEDLRRVRNISHQMTAVILRKEAEEQVQLQLRRMSALSEIDRAINSGLDMRLSLDILVNDVISQLEVDAASVLLLDSASHTLDYIAGQGFRSAAIRESSLRLGEGLAGKVGLERKVLHVPNLAQADSDFKRAKLLKNEDFVEYFGAPLIAKGKLKGVLEIFNRTPLRADIDWLNYLETLGGQAAIAIDNAQLFEGMQQSNFELVTAYDATITGWSHAMDLRDKETEGHTQRVTKMTVQLAKKIGVQQQELIHIRRGALLHDIGKLGVPDQILLKPGKLTEEEWVIMRQHAIHAFNMLLPIKYLQPALDIPYCHHEKWDGTGYPRGLKGEQIPLAARIFAIVDVWDALRSDRPYRTGWLTEKTREYIIEQSGKHFEPRVVEAFLKLLDESDSQ